ncbi:hypothetical protein [Haloquadratum walsbyi]|jgi:uncharacterized protein YoxC|uniref:Chromosome segregation protein SMC n=1 Tax=Haloquadratum walsbyi J07HQW2 TaxID=1238425 RepID=U1PRI9_9EURY|nr:hypothetical protein [Haloquadratum walsbyi]ERG96362.1 MAG: hypothetical protein J07HQW2_02839 [Haloquadratum walsbyi J07HQW2]
MSNRLEELESQVTELQAAVNGLTEELVETKERLRLIENNTEIDLSAGSRSIGHESESDAGADESVQPQQAETRTTADASSQETSQNEAKSNTAADTDGNDGESAGDSDIIIA